MNIACKTFIKCDMKVYDLIEENHTLLLMLQHFEIDFRVDDLTVSQLCKDNNISERLFIAVANLYNGFKPKENPLRSMDDVMLIIGFLRNSHKYYREDKYPQISNYIHQLQERDECRCLLSLLTKGVSMNWIQNTALSFTTSKSWSIKRCAYSGPVNSSLKV